MNGDPTIDRRRAHERAEIREALAMSRARESIDRLLGEELIAAAREAVVIWDRVLTSEDSRAHYVAMTVAIDRLEELVGSAHE